MQYQRQPATVRLHDRFEIVLRDKHASDKVWQKRLDRCGLLLGQDTLTMTSQFYI